MMKKNFLRRFKAAVVSAAMIATTFAAPAMSSLTNVSAAALTVPHTFTADGKTGNKGDVTIPSTCKNAKSLTLNFTAPTSAKSVTIGVYGFGTNIEADDYWYDVDGMQEELEDVSGTFSVTFDVPTAIQGHIEKLGMGIWYPKDSSKWTLNSITANGSTTPGPGPGPVTPGPAELPDLLSSGTSKFTDNHDGTATISATLSAEAKIDGESYFDILLTQGYDEKSYAPYKDADGNTLPVLGDDDPINSHKFKYSDFGIYDLNSDTIKLQSFQYDISADYEMTELQYGGGLNVVRGSIADTEFDKYVYENNIPEEEWNNVTEGYWYNDQGEEDAKKYGSILQIKDYHGAYKIKNAGDYATVTWLVPESVQPFVDYSNASNAVGFQYWWGKDDTQKGDEDFFVIPEIHLRSCTCTYTRTVTVPWSETVEQSTGQTLAIGDSVNFSLEDLNLKSYDKLSAIKFVFSSASDLSKFTTNIGISVDSSKFDGRTFDGVDGDWYQGKNIAVINTNGKFEVMWTVPESIKNALYVGKDSNVNIGYYYGDNKGEPVDSVTLDSVEYYVYRSNEDPLEIKGPDGSVLNDGDEITLKVDETYQLKTNVDNCEFVSNRETIATVSESGLITAIAPGKCEVTITTPDDQTATIKVTVEAAEVITTTVVTTKTTTTKATTTTTKATTAVTTTTVDPNKVIDWMYVLYGDVNVDGRVSPADIVQLVKYTISNDFYPLKNATALENANTEYDDKRDTKDSGKIKEYILKHITIMDLGPKDKSKVLRDPYFDATKDSQF